MAIEINKFSIASTKILPCYEERQGQESRAYLYVELRDGGEIWVNYKTPSDYTWSPSEHAGYLHTFRIPNNLTPQGYNDLLDHPMIKELAEIMVKEAEEMYANGNHYIHLSDTGNNAREALERFCDSIEHGDYESLEPAGAHYYLAEGSYEALMCNGGTHEEVAKRIVQEALVDGYYLSAVDVENRLDEMHDEMLKSVDTSKASV